MNIKGKFCSPLWVLGSLFFLGLTSHLAYAITFPRQLNHNDRNQVVRLLGLTTSTKLLTNPFPLGGYSGFEMGVSYEFINVRDLIKLGCDPNTPGCPNTWKGNEELSYPRFILGKGLYHNVDLFFHFTPQIYNSEFFGYGAAARYSFYEANFIPVNMSVVFHGDNVIFSPYFQSLALGVDLVAGIYVNNFSFYFGAGQLKSVGTFIAGNGSDSSVGSSDPEIEPASQTVTHTVRQFHTYLGATLHFNDFFLATQLDRYPESTYSVRAGFRF